MRIVPLLLAAIGLLVIGTPGCGKSRLSPRQSCETMIDSAVRCGTYRVGVFGGTSMEEDIDRCTNIISVLNDRCQELASDFATCTTRACEEIESCRTHSERFAAECSPDRP